MTTLKQNSPFPQTVFMCWAAEWVQEQKEEILSRKHRNLKNKQTKKKVLTLPPQAAEASLAVDKPTNVFWQRLRTDDFVLHHFHKSKLRNSYSK